MIYFYFDVVCHYTLCFYTLEFFLILKLEKINNEIYRGCCNGLMCLKGVRSLLATLRIPYANLRTNEECMKLMPLFCD